LTFPGREWKIDQTDKIKKELIEIKNTGWFSFDRQWLVLK
jgi:hypothetical protein